MFTCCATFSSDKHNTKLTDAEKQYFTNFNYRKSNFYGLPKVYKSQSITATTKNRESQYINADKPHDLTFKPIVDGPMCPTSHLSNLIDILIKSLVAFVKSNLRDSTKFINKLPHTVPIETITTTFDITSLYSNIPHNLGIKAVGYWLMEYPDSIPFSFSRQFILEGTKIILNNNTFFFDDRLLLQKKGTAMGTKMAPLCATLVLGYLEKQM